MVKTTHLYLALRREGEPIIVLEVNSFRWYSLGLTTVHSTSEQLPFYVGRQFGNFGQAAHEIHAHLHGKDAARSVNEETYEAYCIGQLDENSLGKGTRSLPFRGETVQTRFSPLLAATQINIAADHSEGNGRWIQCCDLFPFVPPDTPDEEIVQRVLSEVCARACTFFLRARP